jgi:hypothetical protein
MTNTINEKKYTDIVTTLETGVLLLPTPLSFSSEVSITEVRYMMLTWPYYIRQQFYCSPPHSLSAMNIVLSSPWLNCQMGCRTIF